MSGSRRPGRPPARQDKGRAEDMRRVEAFLDAQAAEAGAARNTLLAYGRDLADLAAWTARHGLTLAAGTGGTGPGVAGGTVKISAGTVLTVTGPAGLAPVDIVYNPVSYLLPTDYTPFFATGNGAPFTSRMLVFADGGNKTFDGSTLTTLTGLKGAPAGVTLVAAAGNEFDEGNPLEFPASLPHVITVAALTPEDKSAFFSNENAAIDLGAPGVGILTAVPVAYDTEDGTADGYQGVSGTSFAAPMVAAAAAWVRAQLDGMGFTAAVHDTPGHPIVLGHHPGAELGIEAPTLFEALQAELPEAEVVHERGCAVDDDDTSGFAAARAAAATADVAVVVVGDHAALFGRGTVGEGCDRDDLELYGVEIAVEFYARLRGQVKYAGPEALITQMHADVEHARQVLHAS